MRHWRLKAWMFPVISLTVAAISLAVTLYLVDRIGERIIDDQAQAAAIAERNYMTTLAQEDGLSALITALDRRERIHGGGGFRYALVDQAGHPLAGAKSLTEAAAAKGWRVIELHNAGRQTRWHVLVGSLPSSENLVIAQDAEERKAFRLSILRSSSLALCSRDCLHWHWHDSECASSAQGRHNRRHGRTHRGRRIARARRGD